jgi:hypothetical protein
MPSVRRVERTCEQHKGPRHRQHHLASASGRSSWSSCLVQLHKPPDGRRRGLRGGNIALHARARLLGRHRAGAFARGAPPNRKPPKFAAPVVRDFLKYGDGACADWAGLGVISFNRPPGVQPNAYLSASGSKARTFPRTSSSGAQRLLPFLARSHRSPSKTSMRGRPRTAPAGDRTS